MSGISFKITAPGRPTPSSAPNSRPHQSRHTQHPHRTNGHARGDDSEEDEEDDEGDAFRRAGGRDSKRRRVDGEEVIEFGRDGATSKHAKPQAAAPLVIPALPNKDWRKAAEELRAGRNPGKRREMYLPERGGGMRMREGGDESNSKPLVEADVDAINTEEVVGGLEKREKKVKVERVEEESKPMDLDPKTEPSPPRASTSQVKTEESEEQRAMRELLGEAGGSAKTEEAELEAIISAEDARNGPIEEADAFKRDVDSRPDEASLDDYARVPVGAFGLAMLRGMGWQPGQAASRSGRGAIEAHVPSSRPSLLGIGAKPMAEAMGDGGGKKGAKGKGGSTGGKSRREEMKFMPLIKQAREGSASGRSTPLPITDGSTSSSRRPSRSPPPPSSSSRRDRDRSPRRDRDDRRSSRRNDDDDDRRSSRREDERRRSRYDDDRRSSRYEDERRSSSRRDDEARRDVDRDRRSRDERSSYRDEKSSYRDDRDRDYRSHREKRSTN